MTFLTFCAIIWGRRRFAGGIFAFCRGAVHLKKERRGTFLEHSSIEKDFYFSFEDQVVLKMAPLHYHDLYEIYYLTKGTCQCFVDNCAYQMQAGDVLVIPCESIHKVIYDSKPHSRLLVNFDKSYIPPSLVPLLSDVIHLVRVSRIQKVLENLFQKIKGEYEHPDAFPRSVSSATLPSCSSRLPVHRTAR